MNTRSKRPTRNQRNSSSNVTVMPIALKAGPDSSDAVIPASMKGKGPAEALISVEGKAAGKPVRKRAALIPVAVREHSLEHESHEPGNARRSYPMPWREFLAESAGTLISIEEGIFGLFLMWGQTAAAVFPLLLGPVFGRMEELRTPEFIGIQVRGPKRKPPRSVILKAA